MGKTKMPSTQEYEEETVPFDDVMRQLLKAKPTHKEAKKPKSKKKLEKKKS